jgi:hypothetical protein
MSNITLFAVAALVGGTFVGCNAEAAESPQSLIAEGSDGVAAIIHLEQGICLGDARRAEFVTPGQPNIPGCWKIVGPGVVQMVFWDGDVLTLPRERFQPAKVM